MTDLIGLYGIVVDPIEGVSIKHLPNGRASLNELYSIIDCDYVELSVLTDELDLFVDEEGLVNGAAQRIGCFQVQDADGERLGQVMYAGRGVILQNAEDDSVGFTRQRATAIVESLTFQGMAVL
tara:strand:+ start:710 stop:1081 length:372 start_codon:yes stop_codon:yes gene_type:complete